jgi:hypothetical protein
MRRHRLLAFAAPLALLASFVGSPPVAGTTATQSNDAYAASYAANSVNNVFATGDKIVSCYRPEVPYFDHLSGYGYSGMSSCSYAKGTSPTGEDTGVAKYPSQVGSNQGYPADGPMLVKNHSESDIRVDPTNSQHLIGTSKWAVSAEGYNHLLGFFESFNGGQTWPVQGHIPGYEGWTDNTDPVGAFDAYGNFYALVLPYQFYYNPDGTHNFKINPNLEPNPSVPAETITIAVRPHGSTTATQWSSTSSMDVVASYPAKGREPDKQWITIDTNLSGPHPNRIYAMWTIFDGIAAVPVVSYADGTRYGTHSAWSQPVRLPMGGQSPQGDTYALPHVAGNGTVYTTLTNFTSHSTVARIVLDRSTDGGATWETLSTVVSNIAAPPASYPNTNFRDGIENTFAVGQVAVNGVYPLYVTWEDYSRHFGDLQISASHDGGLTWSNPIKVNDNSGDTDAFQPNLTTAANGRVLVAFYDRRLDCPAATTAAGVGLELDTTPPYGAIHPYGAHNYCVNASLQVYKADLTTVKGSAGNIRISEHTWDPQLNSMKPSGINRPRGFIGDYFGIDTAGTTVYTTSVSTYNNGTNAGHFQQQVVASLTIP